jgi:hypothetical protein
MGGASSTHDSDEKSYKTLVRKPEGKKQLVRSRSRKKDNIRMDVREIERESVDWIHLA